MASNLDITNILASLKRLYLRIMALQTKGQARKSITSTHSSRPKNVTKSLSDCISKLAKKAASDPVNVTKLHVPETHISDHAHSTISRDTSTSHELGELSLHLKDSHKYTGVSQDTGARLAQSTWEHFHASIRLARQGNTSAALLHRDLANSALIEAERYLPEQEYARLSKELMEAIKEISNQV